MSGIVVFWILIIIAVSLSNNKKKNRKQDGTSPNRSGNYRTSASGTASRSAERAYSSAAQGGTRTVRSGTGRTASARNTSAGGRKAQEKWYIEPDNCDAEISFKDLRPGTDELEALIRHNARHEKSLEARLSSRENME